MFEEIDTWEARQIRAEQEFQRGKYPAYIISIVLPDAAFKIGVHENMPEDVLCFISAIISGQHVSKDLRKIENVPQLFIDYKREKAGISYPKKGKEKGYSVLNFNISQMESLLGSLDRKKYCESSEAIRMYYALK